MTESVDVEEFRQGFLGEADEHVGRITSNLAAIERAPGRPHARELAELFRSLHTLKGLAGMMAITPIAELAHAMESLVRGVQRHGSSLPPDLLDPLLHGTQVIAQRIRAVADRESVAPIPEALLAELERSVVVAPSATEPRASTALDGLDPEIAAKLTASEVADLEQAIDGGQPILRIAFRPSPERAAAGISITSVRNALGAQGRIVRVLPRAVPQTGSAPGGLEFVLLVVSTTAPVELAAAASIEVQDIVVLSAAATVPDAPLADDGAFDRGRGVVRMDVAKLDAALEHVSALGVGHIRMRDELTRVAGSGQDVRTLRRQLEEDRRELRRLRSVLLALRMVPLRQVLEPVPLIIRGMRGSTGKDVRLAVDVGDAELDKTVAERLLPALVHLVRNAVDHGIEDPRIRRERGKSETGTVRLTAVAVAGAMLEITVADDGGGIDAEAVARRAGAPAPADDAALLDLLTAAGFSTREAATLTSGRGIGLDVVRQTMDALGGSLELANEPGRGTAFRLRAPLTVAILDAFAFEAGGERYLAPIAVVDAIVELDANRIVHPPDSGRDAAVDLVELRGDVFPLVSLPRALGLPRGTAETKAMIVRRAGQRVAFSIARMLGRHEVLVRPIVDPLVRVPAISGSADLGDGRPTLVVDLQRLAHGLALRRPEVVA
jgi:two-component system chemotaxis sensor kinase CheA